MDATCSASPATEASATTPMKIGNLLVRGMLAGLLAAVLAFAFASIFGEPQVDNAIAVEESQAAPPEAGHDHGGEEELVSRGVQSTAGLAVATGAYGLAFGGLFALAFAFAYGRIGNLGARATAGVLRSEERRGGEEWRSRW